MWQEQKRLKQQGGSSNEAVAKVTAVAMSSRKVCVGKVTSLQRRAPNGGAGENAMALNIRREGAFEPQTAPILKENRARAHHYHHNHTRFCHLTIVTATPGQGRTGDLQHVRLTS